jgi:thiosulfate/3-mercaptopyruvate sulfurtransferase
MLARALSGFGLLTLLAAPAGARPRLLVTTEWLAQHLSDPSVVVLHVGRDRSSYDAGHLPGARLLLLGELAVTRDGIPNELPPLADLQRLFEGLGINDRTNLVLYGDTLGLLATRAYFTLDYLGRADRAVLLDGGLEKWRAEGRAVSRETPQWKPGRFRPRPRPEVVASTDTVRQPPPGVILLDARASAEYAAGHIPGAVNVFWVDSLLSKANPVLRPVPELRRIYEAAGVKRGSRVVTYCVSGVQATHPYFVLKLLGYRVALYDGSLTAWRKVPGVPLVTGPQAR